MSIRFNHTIVHSRDKKASATFLADILGLPTPSTFGHFLVVELENCVSLDFIDAGDTDVIPQHYAFLIEEAGFDAIFGRIRARGLQYWADPLKKRVGGDEPQRWRARHLLRRPRWPSPRSSHASLRQRRIAYSGFSDDEMNHEPLQPAAQSAIESSNPGCNLLPGESGDLHDARLSTKFRWHDFHRLIATVQFDDEPAAMDTSFAAPVCVRDEMRA